MSNPPWSSSTRRQRLPKDWPAITKRIKKRDGYRCVQCQSTEQLEVDHIVAGDNHHDTNLQTLCHPCHQTKTNLEALAARTRYPRKREPERHPGLRQA